MTSENITPTSDLSHKLNMPASQAAQRLLGSILERTLDGHIIQVRIVETEAYDETDAASHSYKGRTPRNDIMFGPAGYLYVYFTYGMHYCCNIVVGNDRKGAAVLIRAVEPLNGTATLEKFRPNKHGRELTNGPAKLCKALNIDKRMNGHDLRKPPLRLILTPKMAQKDTRISTRIGISQSKDMVWRFYIANNPYVSN
jgi:DNA-3-methyladenine glycosylase